MYTKYFGFNEKPFTLTPNPRFIFLSKNHKEAFAHLLYGINNHYGFIELVGEVGTGKTTVLRTLLGQLQEENYRSALIFNPCLTGVELLRSINQEFGIDAKSAYANELLATLNRFLLNENREGRTVVLVIDEAQNLQVEVLEQVRLISNLETENDKLIQIILAGQPELEVLMERPELRQLNQRIAVRYKLRAMSMDETRAYIRHRMEIAGETGGVSFSRYAIKWIYFYTRGVPRMINILCDRALLVAYGEERRSISSATVTRAIREILNIGQNRRLSLAFGAIAALAIFAITGFALLRWFPAHPLKFRNAPIAAAAVPKERQKPAVGAEASVPSVPATAPSSLSPSGGTLLRELQGSKQQDVQVRAFNGIMEKWEANPIKIFSGQMTVPATFARLAAKRNLQITPFSGTLDEALRFDLPFVVMTKAEGVLGNYCIAVTSANKTSLTIAPQFSTGSSISKEELGALANGTFYLAWRNSGQIPSLIKPMEKRYEVRALQRLLQQAGFYQDEIDGDYNTATISAVRDFQRSQHLPQNDSVGELTLAALSRFDNSQKAPSLKRK